MLKRMGQLLERVRGVKPHRGSPEAPPKKWADDLAEAGIGADAWIARRLAAGHLFVDLTDARVARLSALEPVVMQATLDAASRVLRHEFNLLGSGPYTPVDPDRAAGGERYQPIDWYLDPVSGLRFPRGIPHKKWNLETMRPGLADIKLPWELGRCQHWAVLGEAYRLTGDDRYAMEIARQLHDFMEANPVGTGVNWTCTMDVAIRAANWALGLELIRSCQGLSLEFWREAYDALFDHGVFIERNLENTFEVTSNHFLSNIVGLFYVAVFFSDLPQGNAWDGQCRTWLEQEMTVQVLPDGADYESSVPYHRLVAELFLGAARLAEHTGRPLSQALTDRLRAMVEFLAAVLRPDGLMPQVGDADDGRLHILSGYGDWQPQDPGHLFGPAACFFENPEWTQIAGRWGQWEAAWWGFPIQAPAATPGPIKKQLASLSQFPNAGLTVIRHRDDYLLITNGVVGTAGFGNHKHNDLLGFEYHVAGAPVIVDPGSYVYTSDPDARNLFRSTRSHNTLSVDGQEQNDFKPEWLFRMFERAAPEQLSLVEDDVSIQYRGRHRGYGHLPQPVVHERSFTFVRAGGALNIVDKLEGSGTHSLRWHFHFAPGVEVFPREAGLFEIRLRHAIVRMTAPAAMRSSVTPAWYSPSYGVRHACVALDLDVVEPIDGCREYTFQIAS
jgi:hypothetical protein